MRGSLSVGTNRANGFGSRDTKWQKAVTYRSTTSRSSLPALKKGHFLGGNLDRIAGFGVASFAGIAAPRSETAKPSQFHLVALFQGIGDTREQNVDDGFGLLLGKVDVVGKPFQQVPLLSCIQPHRRKCSAKGMLITVSVYALPSTRLTAGSKGPVSTQRLRGAGPDCVSPWVGWIRSGFGVA